MSNNKKYIEDFNLGGTDPKYYDLSQYNKALSSDSMPHIVYRIARVTCNPAMAINLRNQEINRLISPDVERASILANNTVMEEGMIVAVDSGENYSRDKLPRSESDIIRALIEDVMEVILSEDYIKMRYDLMVAFSMYLVQSGVYQYESHPLLRRFIKKLSEEDVLNNHTLEKYLGTQYKVKQAIRWLKYIYKDVAGLDI